MTYLHWFKYKHCRRICCIFLEIGSGWKPAVLNTLEEYNFLRIGQKGFTNSDSFWLGGSTNLNGSIEFSDYINSNSGITSGRIYLAL